jgi:hypothetical protein
MAVPAAPAMASERAFDVYFRLYQSHNTMMMHQERSLYVLMRAFFQIITVVFVIEHLPLQVIKDQKIVLLLSFFIKMSLLLTSYTILRKAHRANYHEALAKAYLGKIDEAVHTQGELVNLEDIERQPAARYRLIDHFIFPQINRVAVGLTFMLFSVAIAAFVTIK